jgi:DHA2 family multidrug resistance protein
MAFGMFMALLDVQIVASSLAEIEAGLSANTDEVSWVQTSYLIAEVVMIPLSGWLAQVFSTRWLFAASALGFTVASLLCACAWSIDSMIVFRAVQGFLGGAMIPLAFAAGYAVFKGPKAAVIPAVLGTMATLAPALGPSLGGWITQTYSWHWLFLLNLGPGLMIGAAVPALICIDRPNLAAFRQFDLASVPFIAVALGGLEYILEEGTRAGWFDDTRICAVTAAAAISFAVVLWRGFSHAHPVLDLRAFASRNYALGCLFSFIHGIGLFGSVYVVPLFLAWVQGYDSLQIGKAVFVAGVFQLLSVPPVAILSRRMDPRAMLAAGLVLYGCGLWMMTPICAQWSGDELFWPQAVRGFAGMFIIVPITNLALADLPLGRLKMASGLFNLMRNLGGAVGIAAMSIALQYREPLHFARLAEHVSARNPFAVDTIHVLADRFQTVFTDPARAYSAALTQVNQMVHREALGLSFSDGIWVMTALFFMSALLVPLLRRASGGGSDRIDDAGH